MRHYCYYMLCAVQSDFAHNEKFITIHVVEGNGKRVYYPGELVVS